MLLNAAPCVVTFSAIRIDSSSWLEHILAPSKKKKNLRA